MTMPERPVFFVHLQKTAGTSLLFRLRNQFGLTSIYPAYEDKAVEAATFSVEHLVDRWQTHRDAIRVVTGHFPFCTTELLGGGFTTLTVLRDPVERTLSYLRHHRKMTPGEGDRPLEDIYDDPFRFHTMIHNHMVKMFSLTTAEMTAGMLTQVEFTRDRLERAKENLHRVDVVGIQSRFGEFCDELTRRFGWDLGEPTHANRTEHFDVPESFRQRIAEDNAMDYELFELACGLDEERRAAVDVDPIARRRPTAPASSKRDERARAGRWRSIVGRRGRPQLRSRSDADRRFFFVHIAGTGGERFQRQIVVNVGADRTYPSSALDDDMWTATTRIDRLRTLPAERREQVVAYVGHFPFMCTRLVSGPIATMTILRNPVDRAVSYLRHCQRHRRQFNDMSLEAIYEDPFVSHCAIRNLLTKMFSLGEDDQPTNFLHVVDIDERRLTAARDNLATVDFLGLTEAYPRFEETIARHLGWTIVPSDDLCERDEGPEAPASLIDKINRDNEYDIEFYRYARELHDRNGS